MWHRPAFLPGNIFNGGLWMYRTPGAVNELPLPDTLSLIAIAVAALVGSTRRRRRFTQSSHLPCW